MWSVWVGLVAAALVAGCEGRSPTGQDGAPALEMRVIPDARRPDLGQRDFPPGTRELVVSRLVLPDINTAGHLGHDYDMDGAIDNALGALLGGISSMGIDLQQALDDSVNAGATLLLLRLLAASFVDDPGASARTWLAEAQSCCSTPQSSSQCAAQAKATCFNGTHTFKPDPTDPQGSLLPGAITGGKFVFGPATMKLALPIGGTVPLTLTLKAAYLEGMLSGATVSDGVLAGTLSLAELQSTLIPALALMLNAQLKDPGTDPQVKNILMSLFDANGDGSISLSETANNSVIKTFLGGDVDVDNDGVKELSLGLRFETVRALITP